MTTKPTGSAEATDGILPARTCSTCSFWVLDKDDSYNEIISPNHPGTYEQIDPTEEGGEAKIAALWGHNVRRCRSPKVTFYQRPEKDGATVCDGSGYMAELLTGQDFGCIHHCLPNTQPQPTHAE